jgi:hypothetical protein
MALLRIADPEERLPEYTILPLLQQSLELRCALQSHSQPQGPSQDLGSMFILMNEALRLENGFAAWHRKLPADHPDSHALGKDTLINIWRVHQILIQDVLVRCYYAMEVATGQLGCYDRLVDACMAKSQVMIDAILDSAPYDTPITNGASTQPASNAAIRTVFYHMTFS